MTEICTGAGVCSSWVVQVLCVQVRVFKFVRSGWGVQVGVFCEFLVFILWWSNPPHHVKVIHSGWKKTNNSLKIPPVLPETWCFCKYISAREGKRLSEVVARLSYKI
jgi:hypothetical protein